MYVFVLAISDEVRVGYAMSIVTLPFQSYISLLKTWFSHKRILSGEVALVVVETVYIGFRITRYSYWLLQTSRVE
jgi:hypothetical protein